jgi:hypothetical protein
MLTKIVYENQANQLLKRLLQNVTKRHWLISQSALSRGQEPHKKHCRGLKVLLHTQEGTLVVHLDLLLFLTLLPPIHAL